MFISIVIAAFNSENTIIKCLDSIKNQDFFDYEIVLINDGSNDNTDKVIQQYLRNQKNINIVYKKTDNRGPSHARNIGIGIAKGDYIWFVDSDDEIEKQSLEIIYDSIVNSNCDILRFSCRSIENDIVERHNIKIMEDIYEGEKLDKFICESLRKSWINSMNCWQHVYKKRLIKNTKFLEDKDPYAEDILFNCLVYPCASKIQVIADILYKYYIRSDSLSHSKKKTLKKIISYYTIIKHNYIKNNIWNKYKLYIVSSYGDFAILGGGANKYGAFYSEYNAYDDVNYAHGVIQNICNSAEFQSLVDDGLNRNLPKELEKIYKLLKNRKTIDVYNIVANGPNVVCGQKETWNSDEVVFLIDIEIINLNEKTVVIPVGNTDKPFIIELSKESSVALDYLNKTKSINKTLDLLYMHYPNEDKNEINENLLDFISELKSQKIVG